VAEIHGVCSEKFRAVRDRLEAILVDGKDYGASVAVFVDGKPEVDLWGGYFDETRTRPWAQDTIVNTFSTTKTMTALVMLILADRGELDFDAPIAKYWPEFAANGKGDVLVRHVLSHSSGVPGWSEPMTITDILDWEKATTSLARQAPWWKSGTQVAYHAISYGPLLGEVVRRITGTSLKQFFSDEVARPLGADYHIGAPPEADDRVSLLIQTSPPRPRAGSDTVADRVFYNPLRDATGLGDDCLAARRPGWQQRARQRALRRTGAVDRELRWRGQRRSPAVRARCAARAADRV
jgi:CubicO group peptidase (beta-lactamase class C family)